MFGEIANNDLTFQHIADEIYQNCMGKPIAKDYQFYPVQKETTKQLMQDTSVPNMIFKSCDVNTGIFILGGKRNG